MRGNSRVRAVLLAVLAAALHGAASADDTGVTLVSRWQGENSPADALGVNDGAERGGVEYAAGRDGRGFVLDGTNYVSVANPTLNAHRSAFTITAWMRRDTDDLGPVLNFRNPSNDSGFTLENLGGAPDRMALHVNQTGVAEAFQNVNGGGFVLGTVHHVAATFDSASGTAVLYRDGVPIASRSDLAQVPVATVANPKLQLGLNIKTVTAYWHGLLDDVQFYSSALSGADVAGLAATPGSTAAGLVSRWRGEDSAADEQGVNDGIESGVRYGDGKVGRAFDLDGSGHVSVANPSLNAHREAFSIAGWIRIDAYTTAPVINFRTPANDGGFTMEQFTDNPGSMVLHVHQGGGFQSVNGGGFALGTLYHVAATFDSASGTAVLYRDGAAVGNRSDLPHTPMTEVTNPSLLLGRNVVFGQTWDGLLDDVQFYAGALSAQQVADLAAHPGSIVPSVDTMTFSIAKGKATDSAIAGNDKFTAKGTFAFTGESPDGAFDRVTDAVRLRLGSPSAPLVVDIARDDAGWKANRKGKLTWKSAKGAVAGVKFVIDPAKKTFSVAAKKFTFPGAQANPLAFVFVARDDLGRDQRDWRALPKGKFATP